MASGAQVIGADALASDGRRLTAAGGPLERSLEAAGMSAAQPVAAAVRSSVPRDSGDMAGSVTVKRGSDDASEYAAVEVGYGDLEYAGPVDFGGWPEGRDYVGGGRYLFPAARSLETSTQGPFEQATQRAIDSFPWSQAK